MEMEELLRLERDSMVTVDTLMTLCCSLYAVPKRQLFNTLRYLMRYYEGGQCFRKIRIYARGYYWGNQVRGRPRLHLHFENKYSGFHYIDGYYPGYGQYPPITVRFQLGMVIRELVHSGGIGVDRFPDRIRCRNQNLPEVDDEWVITHTDIHRWEELLDAAPHRVPVVAAFPPTPPPSPTSSATTVMYGISSDDDGSSSTMSNPSSVDSGCQCFRCINCLGHVAEEAGGGGGAAGIQ